MSRGLKDWIQTHPSGGKFFPLDPRPEDIRIEDIARALSMTCRYAGHVSRFYSVAEHSVRVSRLCELKTNVPTVLLWGLLHDASEAYIGDMTRPLKRQAVMAPYRDVESKIQAAIVAKFGLAPFQPQIVTDADVEILGTEAYQLKQPIHPDWAKSTPTGTLPEPLALGLLGWDPEKAERVFLNRFQWLTGLIERGAA